MHDHVLFISMDTCRADHLGCYGYSRGTTPFLSQFAKENVFFKKAFASAVPTLPSHTSVFTSLYQGVHGAEVSMSTAIPDPLKTIAEVLKERGHVTAAFHCGIQLSEIWNVFKGFDVIKHADSKSIAETASWYADFIGKNKDGKTFAFVHGMDMHFPFYQQGKFCAEEGVDKKEVIGILEIDRTSEPDLKRKFSALYDDSISFFDHQIKGIMDWLKKLGIYDKTLIVIFGDHGEAIGERERITGHDRNLDEDIIRVPLFMRLPGFAPSVVDTNVRLIDVMPTVLSVMGISAATVMQGKDLTSVILGDEVVDLCVFTECKYPNFYAMSIRTSSFKLVYEKKKIELRLGFKDLRSVLRFMKRACKYAYYRVSGRDQFQVSFTNLLKPESVHHMVVTSTSKNNTVSRLLDMIEAQMKENVLLREKLVKEKPKELVLKDEMKERLKALGYL